MSGDPALSVVSACADATRTVERAMAGLQAACDGIEAEILAVHAADARLATLVETRFPGVRCLDAGADALVPQLWAHGLRHARGRVVAFTTGHFIVTPGWARALLDAIAGGATGAGGPIELGPNAGVLGRAIYFLRYSAFMPGLNDDGEVVGEIAGDNAAYARDALDRHADSFGKGFWEVEFHRLVRADGGHLVMAADAVAATGESYTMGKFMGHRYLHGRHFGAFRIETLGTPKWRVVLAAPLVPFVLTGRILGRAVAASNRFWPAVASVPTLVALGGAWAAGEARGAAAAHKSPSGSVNRA